ncbi:hypothetical protein [Bradyrhizobium sp. SYSU BS000235]
MPTELVVLLSVVGFGAVVIVWWRVYVGWDAKRLREEWTKLKDHPPYM